MPPDSAVERAPSPPEQVEEILQNRYKCKIIPGITTGYDPATFSNWTNRDDQDFSERFPDIHAMLIDFLAKPAIIDNYRKHKTRQAWLDHLEKEEPAVHDYYLYHNKARPTSWTLPLGWISFMKKVANEKYQTEFSVLSTRADALIAQRGPSVGEGDDVNQREHKKDYTYWPNKKKIIHLTAINTLVSDTLRLISSIRT